MTAFRSKIAWAVRTLPFLITAGLLIPGDAWIAQEIRTFAGLIGLSMVALVLFALGPVFSYVLSRRVVGGASLPEHVIGEDPFLHRNEDQFRGSE